MNQTNSSYAGRACLCLIIFLLAFTPVFSQTISMVVKNGTMEEALRQVKEKSGFRVLYNASTLEGCKPVTVNLKNTTLELALQAIFKGQPITYTISKDVIILRRTEDVISPATLTPQKAVRIIPIRSEERRVGKEC